MHLDKNNALLRFTICYICISFFIISYLKRFDFPNFFLKEHISIIKYKVWDKSSIMFPSTDYELASLDYHNISFSEYIYNHNEYISNEIRRTKKWCDCEHIYNILHKYARNRTEDMVALDIGANIGACSLLLMAMQVKTIAFEPLPKNLHLFTRSLLYNPQFLPLITLYPIALGNTESLINISYQSQNMGSSSALFKSGANCIQVPSVPLNDVLQNLVSPIIFAKIDVEGYEPYVIEGAENFLKNQQIKIIFYEKSCQAGRNIYDKIDNLFFKYNYTSSFSTCKYSSDLINILVIANDYIKEKGIDKKELIRTKF